MDEEIVFKVMKYILIIFIMCVLGATVSQYLSERNKIQEQQIKSQLVKEYLKTKSVLECNNLK